MSKTLDRVSKLLNQAENAGTPEEAEAFMAKAQEMAALNAIDLAVARMHQAKKEKAQEPEERIIKVNPWDRKHNRKHFIDLGLAICDVNDIKTLIGGEHVIYALGFPEDLDVVEALYTHLSIQMATECDEALKRGENKGIRRVAKTETVEIPDEERDWGGWDGRSQYYDEDDEGTPPYGSWRSKPYPPPKTKKVPLLDDDGNKIYEEKEVSAVDGRVFRSHFYAAFIERMRSRLFEIKSTVERQAEAGGVEALSSETGLALRDKKEAVSHADEERRAKVKHMGTYGGADGDKRKHDFTGTARKAGRESAARVPIEHGREVKNAS